MRKKKEEKKPAEDYIEDEDVRKIPTPFPSDFSSRRKLFDEKKND